MCVLFIIGVCLLFSSLPFVILCCLIVALVVLVVFVVSLCLFGLLCFVFDVIRCVRFCLFLFLSGTHVCLLRLIWLFLCF